MVGVSFQKRPLSQFRRLLGARTGKKRIAIGNEHYRLECNRKPEADEPGDVCTCPGVHHLHDENLSSSDGSDAEAQMVMMMLDKLADCLEPW